MTAQTQSPFQARIARDLVIVEGPDATSFLQSLVSQDLDGVGVGESVHSLLLQPQGKLLVDFYALHHASDTWWCVCEGGFGPALAEGLGRFKIRVNAGIRNVAVAALAVRGVVPAPASGVALVAVAWGGVPAVDAVGGDEAVVAFGRALGLPSLDDGEYDRARIEAGVPRQGFDVDERTIPQEAGLEHDAVSFTKGCFVGQELVCRIDTRGHVNRVLRRLRSDGTLARGAEVVQGDKVVGEVTSAGGPVALAMVRREVGPGAEVAAAGVRALVEEL